MTQIERENKTEIRNRYGQIQESLVKVRLHVQTAKGEVTINIINLYWFIC